MWKGLIDRRWLFLTGYHCYVERFDLRWLFLTSYHCYVERRFDLRMAIPDLLPVLCVWKGSLISDGYSLTGYHCYVERRIDRRWLFLTGYHCYVERFDLRWLFLTSYHCWVEMAIPLLGGKEV